MEGVSEKHPGTPLLVYKRAAHKLCPGNVVELTASKVLCWPDENTALTAAN